MNNHSTHLRKNISEFKLYEEKYANSALLNCGIIGGNIKTILTLMNLMVDVHLKFSLTNKSLFTLDMGVFNFIARTIFDNNLIHGFPVNSVFKNYEIQNFDCWFKHK